MYIINNMNTLEATKCVNLCPRKNFPWGQRQKWLFIFLLKKTTYKQSSTYCSKSEPQITYVAHITEPVKRTP